MKRTNLSLATIIIAVISMAACNSSNSSSEESAQEETESVERDLSYYETLGDSMVMIAQTKLLSELQNSMETSGLNEAVKYCNVNAIGIMELLSDEYDVQFRRSSIRYRNPADAPIEHEQGVLEEWQTMAESGDKPIPFAEYLSENQIAYYSPIYIGAELCLKCHGVEGETLDPEVKETISTLYPADLATGYELGEFRGIWSLSFNL